MEGQPNRSILSTMLKSILLMPVTCSSCPFVLHALIILLSSSEGFQVVERAIWQRHCVILKLRMVEMHLGFTRWTTIS